MRTIVWFRGKDLRLADHGPLLHALGAGEVIPLFVLDPYFFSRRRARQLPHRMQFLLDSLAELRGEIEKRGSRLVLVQGRSVQLVPALVKQWRADRVVAHRWVEPFARKRDQLLRAELGERFQLFEGETLLPPGALRTQAGSPYSVFTRFHRTFMQEWRADKAAPSPVSLPPLPRDIDLSEAPLPHLSDLGITRNSRLLAGGVSNARDRLLRFVKQRAKDYGQDRDRMDISGTSQLSADLKFGLLSPRQVWNYAEKKVGNSRGGQAFLRQLVWREFAYSSLWDRPELLLEPFRPAYRGFPWRSDPRQFRLWQQGCTGYPVVDAAARQLLEIGYVHNRARMIAASFLTKHLMIDYRWGEAHYLKYLTDGDWAQNNAGWQWSAGCGCDAQPYFRVFNPTTQGEKFDPSGDYVRTWVPELAQLPTKFIHCPSAAPTEVLRSAGISLGSDYPLPLVDHRYGRERFLATAAQHIKGPQS